MKQLLVVFALVLAGSSLAGNPAVAASKAVPVLHVPYTLKPAASMDSIDVAVPAFAELGLPGTLSIESQNRVWNKTHGPKRKPGFVSVRNYRTHELDTLAFGRHRLPLASAGMLDTFPNRNHSMYPDTVVLSFHWATGDSVPGWHHGLKPRTGPQVVVDGEGGGPGHPRRHGKKPR